MSAIALIGDHSIGSSDSPVYVIAEAGVNHNGDAAIAHQLIDTAARAGADAVKFQTFDAAQVVAATGRTTPYQQRAGASDSQLDLLRTLMLPTSVWIELKHHADECGLTFLSTPFDPASAELLATLGVAAIKIGSGELTNIPFLAAVARLGLPMLLSTGMAELDEVDRALQATAPAPWQALFHCVSAYPAPVDQANLRAITTMRDAFGVPVGWSDHTIGSQTTIAAVTLGAAMIEKHFTLDRAMPGPDHAASMEPGELDDFVATIRSVTAALGTGRKHRAPIEQENATLVRRSWHLRKPVAAGEPITAEAVVPLRPETGLPPWVDPVGRRAARDLAPGDPLRAEDLT